MKCKVALRHKKKTEVEEKEEAGEWNVWRKESEKSDLAEMKKLPRRQSDLIGSGVKNGNGLFLLPFLSLSSSDDVTQRTHCTEDNNKWVVIRGWARESLIVITKSSSIVKCARRKDSNTLIEDELFLRHTFRNPNQSL